VIVRFLRALRLRCPWCGGGPVLASWLRLRARCPQCGLALERGGDHKDDWIGALAFNLIALELLFVLAFVAIAARTWPNPPWDLLLWGSVIVLAAGGFVGYPFARLAWLAFDLTFRPPTTEEFE
jgi:uncharacterized protein (DUF983 family)